jgi:hypothetical protein
MLRNHMRHVRSSIALSLFTAFIAACSSSSVSGLGGSNNGAGSPVGHWQTTDATGVTTLAIETNATASVTFAASGSCSGTQTNSGYSWSASGSTLSFAGIHSCTGMYTCPMSKSDCTTSELTDLAGVSCTYAIGNNQLTLSACSSTSVNGTLTRQ